MTLKEKEIPKLTDDGIDSNISPIMFDLRKQKQPEFKERGKWDQCGGKHDWKLLIFQGKHGVAICNKCAELQGGWINHD